MRIEDATQTVGGHPVRIYATDGGIYSNNIHGAIWRSGWQFQVWKSTGEAALPITESVYDLDLHNWRDDIPWECLRNDIQWAARDLDGTWFGFADKPMRSDITATWFGGRETSLKGVKMPSGPADWREAIAKRPET
jgi:hypothetical protein